MNKTLLFKALIFLPLSLYFNFHYLPFLQAIKIPIIFLSRTYLKKMKGTVKIKGKIKPGMIRLGHMGNSLYLQSNFRNVWCNYGGECVFSDKNHFTAGFAIEIGKQGYLKFGDNILLGPLVRIAAYDHIEIGDNSRIAWESIVLDTDFHSTKDIKTGKSSPLTKPIKIGRNNWIGIRCFVMKGTETPDFCIASAYSLLNKKYDIPNYSLIGGVPAKFLKEGLYRDLYSHVNDIQKLDKETDINL